MKTESIEEYLNRGGRIMKVSGNYVPKWIRDIGKPKTENEFINSKRPEYLKFKMRKK